MSYGREELKGILDILFGKTDMRLELTKAVKAVGRAEGRKVIHDFVAGVLGDVLARESVSLAGGDTVELSRLRTGEAIVTVEREGVRNPLQGVSEELVMSTLAELLWWTCAEFHKGVTGGKEDDEGAMSPRQVTRAVLLTLDRTVMGMLRRETARTRQGRLAALDKEDKELFAGKGLKVARWRVPVPKDAEEWAARQAELTSEDKAFALQVMEVTDTRRDMRGVKLYCRDVWGTSGTAIELDGEDRDLLAREGRVLRRCPLGGDGKTAVLEELTLLKASEAEREREAERRSVEEREPKGRVIEMPPREEDMSDGNGKETCDGREEDE